MMSIIACIMIMIIWGVYEAHKARWSRRQREQHVADVLWRMYRR